MGIKRWAPLAGSDFEEDAEGTMVEFADVAGLVLLDNGARGVKCPCCSKQLSLCGKHGLYVRADENQCPACMRGE
jgi:hypothetical protein